MWSGSCMRRMPGATSVMSVVACSASCRGMRSTLLTRWTKPPARSDDCPDRSDRRRTEDVVAVVTEFRDALEDVLEGSVGAGLVRGLGQHSGIPPADEFLDRRHVHRAVVQVPLDRR